MSSCSVYASGHVYENDGGCVYTCKCSKKIMFDETTKLWYVLVSGKWVKDVNQ